MKNFALLTLIAVLTACGGGGGSGSTTTSPQNPTGNIQDKIQGLWEKRGYGLVLRIRGSSVESFDITSQTCFRSGVDDIGEFSNAVLSEDGTEFSLKSTELAFADRFYKTNTLPQPCNTPIGDSPSEIYQHAWHSFNEYYAFFTERNVDWLQQRDLTRELVNDDMSDELLLDVLSTLIAPIDDEHVFLSAGDAFFDPARSKGFLLELLDEFHSQTEVSDVNEYVALQLDQWNSIIHESYLAGDAVSAAGGTFLWGIIADRIGYLRIDAMILNFNQSLSDQVATVETTLDKIMTQLQHTEGMIVDVRLNGGGADPIAFAIARRFADAERLVASKFTRTAEGEGSRQNMYLSPGDRPGYLKPVVLVTSKFSTSATEVFTLAMRTWPHVTHIGEATNGSLSDTLEKPLPNGWWLELANEVYLDGNGNSFESVGIPPQIEVPIFRLEERRSGRDSALDSALGLLGVDYSVTR